MSDLISRSFENCILKALICWIFHVGLVDGNFILRIKLHGNFDDFVNAFQSVTVQINFELTRKRGGSLMCS